jgi:hypothetical protein
MYPSQEIPSAHLRASCPGRIHENVRIFIPCGKLKLWFSDRITQKTFFIILCPVRAMGANDYEIPIRKIEMGVNGIDHLLELGIKDDHPGTTILDDEFEFRTRQSPVERDENGPDF